jgi:hypothetical protein
MGYVSGNVILGNVILRTVEKTTPLTPAEYNGFARAGELVIDPNTFPPTLYVGDRNGLIQPLAGGGGGSGSVINNFYSNNANIQNLYSNGNVNFNDSSNVSLGNVANLHILGGLPGQFLQTVYGNNPGPDGTLQWADPETDLQFNANLSGGGLINNPAVYPNYGSSIFSTNNHPTAGVTVDYNATGVFNPATGVFTASKAGHYLINASIASQATFNAFTVFEVGLFRNGGLHAAMWSLVSTTTLRAGGGGSTVIKLAAGDTLDVRVMWDHMTGPGDGVVVSGNFSAVWLRKL